MTLSASGDSTTHILGGTDQTEIGNSSDSLKVNVTNFPATQPVSGTVTANQGTANTAANAWPQKITDGTNTAAVKAASTAAVATDPSLVVTLSPNTALPAGSNALGSVSVSNFPATQAVTQSTSPWVSNISQFGGNNVVTGTGAGGSGIPRVTVSNDSNVLATQSGTWTVQQGSAPWSVTQSSGPWTNNVTQFGGTNISTGTGAGGAGIPRVTVSNDSNILVSQSTSPWVNNISQFGGSNVVTGTGASGSGIPRVTVANDSNILATQSGTWTVTSTPGTNNTATYSASANAFTSAASATDIFTLTGSGTKTITITRIDMTATTSAGSGLTVNLILVKRSAANTGGSTTSMTAVPHDSNNAAATATAVFYTANASSLGAAVGNLRATRYSFDVSGVATEQLAYEFGDRPSQPIILRGTSQILAINLGAPTITTPIVSLSIEWTES